MAGRLRLLLFVFFVFLALPFSPRTPALSLLSLSLCVCVCLFSPCARLLGTRVKGMDIDAGARAPRCRVCCLCWWLHFFFSFSFCCFARPADVDQWDDDLLCSFWRGAKGSVKRLENVLS
jgi:hypothetical protein